MSSVTSAVGFRKTIRYRCLGRFGKTAISLVFVMDTINQRKSIFLLFRSKNKDIIRDKFPRMSIILIFLVAKPLFFKGLNISSLV